MLKILVYSESMPLASELVTAAAELGADVNSKVWVAVVNNEEQAAKLAAMGMQVCSINSPQLNIADTAAMSKALKDTAEQLETSIVLLASNRRGKELAGRLAQAWGTGCLTDVKTVSREDGRTVVTRNTLGGATVATQYITSGSQVMAVSPHSFPAWNEAGEGRILNMDIVVTPSVEVLEVKPKAGDTIDIQAANRLIAVGQGVENQEDLAVIEQIAKGLDAVVACSKPVATDKKWFSDDRIIGLSGKICKPELVVTLGVSGQVQFMVGIRESKTIVSINKDENADLNKMADYILVADLKEVLPELARLLG